MFRMFGDASPELCSEAGKTFNAVSGCSTERGHGPPILIASISRVQVIWSAGV